MYNIENIMKIRNVFIESLENYAGSEKIKIDFSNNLLDNVLFDYLISNVDKEKYKVFAIPKELLEKIDMSLVSFDNFLARNFDFSKLSGVKINPQTLKYKTLEGAILDGVEFIGGFDDVNIYRTNFTGSRGAVINPQTILNKVMVGSKMSDVVFNGSFDDVYIRCADFSGSKNVMINPMTIRNHDLSYTILKDVVFSGKFNGVYIHGANFTGSFNASINLQEIYNKDCSNANLTDSNIENDITKEGLEGIKIYKTLYNSEYISDLMNCKRLVR